MSEEPTSLGYLLMPAVSMEDSMWPCDFLATTVYL